MAKDFAESSILTQFAVFGEHYKNNERAYSNGLLHLKLENENSAKSFLSTHIVMGNCVIASIGELVNSINNTIENVLQIPNVKITLEDIRYYSDINNTDRYKILLIPKKHKREFRTVFSPQGKLSIILKAINEILNTLYVPEKYVSGFVRHRSIVDNAYLHIGQEFLLNVDLKDFFDSIKYDRIVENLTRQPYNFTSSVAHVITLLTCVASPKDKTISLAQGSPIAPIISNIVFEQIDRNIYNYCCTWDVKYSRYADDLTFSCKRDILYKEGTFFQAITNILTSNHFFLNNEKSRLRNRSQRQEVTGILVNVKPNVSREYIKEIRDLLYIWKKHGIVDAYRSFYKHHKIQLRTQKKDTPYFVNFLRGKIIYLGLVRGYSDSCYIRFTQLFNSLLEGSNGIYYPIGYTDFNSKVVESGINLSSYSTKIDQFGNKRTYLTSGKYGNIYFKSTLLKKLIDRDWEVALEFFSTAMETNRVLSDQGGFLFASVRERNQSYSPIIKNALKAINNESKIKKWFVHDVQKLSQTEIARISNVVVVESKYGLSAKISYKNGAIKYIPMDRYSPASIGEHLKPENIDVIILKNQYHYIEPIKRIGYRY